MFPPDQLRSTFQRQEAHVVKSLPGSEKRLEVGWDATRTTYGKVGAIDFDKAVAPLVIEVYGLADSFRMHTSCSADVTPPRHDLREVSQRAVAPGQKVLDHLLCEALPPDALVQQWFTA